MTKVIRDVEIQVLDFVTLCLKFFVPQVFSGKDLEFFGPLEVVSVQMTGSILYLLNGLWEVLILISGILNMYLTCYSFKSDSTEAYYCHE